MKHKPVLLKEVIEILNPKSGDFIIDGTIGEGGHSKEIIKKIAPGGTLLGIDWDEKQVEEGKRLCTDSGLLRAKALAKTKMSALAMTRKVVIARESEAIQGRRPSSLRAKAKQSRNRLNNKTKIIIEQGNYVEIPNIIKKHKVGKANGLLLDLGFSSRHLESGRGFTFQKDEPLDMRYDESTGESAAEIVNTYKEKDLADIIYAYGEERRSRQIAKSISEARKREEIKTTNDLVEAIGGKRGRIHPATRTFQALRIYINKEYENIETILKKLPEIMKQGGRVAIITFHSGEDRIVKNYFKEYEDKGMAKRINKKVIKPTREEIQQNPRSRSAKLRGLHII